MTSFPALRRRLTTALVVTVLSLAGVGSAASAQDAGGDTSAVAVNTKDGSTLFRFAFSIKQIMGEVVDQSNAAVAYANCEECTTVAISVQVLLVSGSPDEVTPTNLAVALNEDCTECQTLAAAYQFVFGNGEELRFTAEGRRRIADIRRRFQALRNAGLSVEEIQEQADALAGELRDVLRTEITTRGASNREGADQSSQAQADEGAATTPPPATTPEETPAQEQTETTPAQTTPPTQTTPPAQTTPQTQTAPPEDSQSPETAAQPAPGETTPTDP